MRLIDAERLREELLWKNVFLTDNEIDALVDLIDDQPTIFPLNEPLTLDELRAMVGNPVRGGQAAGGGCSDYRTREEEPG